MIVHLHYEDGRADGDAKAHAGRPEEPSHCHGVSVVSRIGSPEYYQLQSRRYGTGPEPNADVDKDQNRNRGVCIEKPEQANGC